MIPTHSDLSGSCHQKGISRASSVSAVPWGAVWAGSAGGLGLGFRLQGLALRVQGRFRIAGVGFGLALLRIFLFSCKLFECPYTQCKRGSELTYGLGVRAPKHCDLRFQVRKSQWLPLLETPFDPLGIWAQKQNNSELASCLPLGAAHAEHETAVASR